jgi:hypothetical protein
MPDEETAVIVPPADNSAGSADEPETSQEEGKELVDEEGEIILPSATAQPAKPEEPAQKPEEPYGCAPAKKPC